MPDAVRVLADRLQAAFDTVSPGADPVLRPSDRADFQANGALPLGKQLSRPPREVAEQVVAAADLEGVCSHVEVSGPGFVNLTLADDFIASHAAEVSADARLGVPVVTTPQTVLIDYSSPNVAKEMHVGHLRATTIGDALARVLTFQGHTVLRENHIGDWGTPFGMLIEHLLDVDGAADAESFNVRDLNEFYAAARVQFDSDPEFAERSRRRVVLLQSGDPETMRLWHIFVAESMRHAREVYAMLGVLLTEEDTVGESYYNPLLPVVVDELTEKGLLVEDDGALCVFPEGFANRQGDPLPLIVRKSDGGYGYPATDLAAVRDRTGRLGAERLLYVVGAEQSLHLRMVFAVSALAGYLRQVSDASHVAFGLVLGADGKKLASRGGGSERLVDLLSEAVERAAAAMKDRDRDRESDLSPEQQAAVARALGVGAVKYADLSTEPIARLRLRLGPHAGGRGQLRSVPPVRPRPHPLDLPAGRGRPAAGRPHAAARRGARTRPGLPPSAVRRGGRGDRREPQPLQALHLSLRPGNRLHDVLRGLPGARRRRRRADLAARAVRPHGAGARAGPLAPGHGGPRADVTGAGADPILCPAHHDPQGAAERWI